MPRNELITAPQLKRLQTLWGIHWKAVGELQSASVADSRLGRLGWIAGVIGRQLASAKNLSRSEAIRVLDALAKLVPAHLVKKHHRPDRRTAKSYGTAGRKNRKQGQSRGFGSREQVIDLIDAPTWRLLNGLLEKLGWTRARLDAFVLSPHGPRRLVTLADANKVIWALKQMLRREKKKSALATSHSPLATQHSPLPLEEEVAAK